MCATNESKLKKIFKKVYKTTIYGYIQKLRLEKANLLLKEQSLNIGEIAKEVGYKHQGHFSSWDKKTDFPQIVAIIMRRLRFNHITN